MSIVPDSVLVKSKAARDHQLERISHGRAQQILNKLKVLYFAVWKGEGTTTELLTDFYEVPEVNIRQLLETHRAEFELDGLQNLRGKELKQVRGLLSLTSMTVNATTRTPRAAMRLWMLLRNSALAQAFRTSLLDAIEIIIPAQALEIERLKLEVELARAKEGKPIRSLRSLEKKLLEQGHSPKADGGYLLVSAVANLLSLSDTWIQTLIESKKLRAIKDSDYWSIKPKWLRKFVFNHPCNATERLNQEQFADLLLTIGDAFGGSQGERF